MKDFYMKTINGIIVALILLASSIPAFAIDGLQISVPSTNAVLSWPSLTNEIYVIGIS